MGRQRCPQVIQSQLLSMLRIIAVEVFPVEVSPQAADLGYIRLGALLPSSTSYPNEHIVPLLVATVDLGPVDFID